MNTVARNSAPAAPGNTRRQGALVTYQRVFANLLNRYFARLAGGDRRPVFFDIARTCPQLNAVTAAYPLIRAEFERLLQSSTPLPSYHELDSGQATIAAASPQRWSVFLLEAFGEKPLVNRARCPHTTSAIARVPNVVQAFFSILEAGKSVPEHCGPYLGYLRYHLGLIVPKTDPPGLILNGIRHCWEEGQAVLFDDSWPHSVENQSRDLRAVLIIDIRRPLPFFADVLNKLATEIGGRYTYGRKVVRKAEAYAIGR